MRTKAAVSLLAIAPMIFYAQSGGEPRFEVASVRPGAAPARPNYGSVGGGPGTSDPEDTLGPDIFSALDTSISA